MFQLILALALAGLVSSSWAATQEEVFQAASGRIHDQLMDGGPADCTALAESFAEIRKLADDGYVPARIYHGINLMHDQVCIDADAERGHAMLEAVAAAGSEEYAPVAMAYLGAEAYARGDYAAALPLLQAGAAHDVAVANHYLGSMYATGHGVPKSDTLAARYWSAASTAGVAEAQYNIALMYIHGLGVSPDPVIAAVELALCKEQLHKRDADDQYRATMAGLNDEQRSYVRQTAARIAADLSAGNRAPLAEDIALWHPACPPGVCF